ncbi:MAG: TonB-dependent receptor plug domain-containing protein [Bacteroidales bacterium]|nr:TonB-dependent receptor plug domain-containing protein [Bacteroidales bacterium]MDD4670629.1 TonB-dependent receptor plug domain-containing protein [Bacteroidales bacterium]
MRKTFLMAAMLLSLCAQAQQNNQLFNLQPHSEDADSERIFKIDSVVISSNRVGRNTPIAHTDVSKEQLRLSNSLSSLPLMLSLQPSVVSTNEGGTGLGYSKMRVRGSDGTRINVTLNGVALNDSESQEVFWVNIPALSGMLQSVQLQRGVGTSVNGPGAFGASINMHTLYPQEKPYGEVELSAGSYLTGIATIGAGSGRMTNGLSFDMRYSYNTTEGYIRNAFARLHSLYASVGWSKDDNSLKINYILGKQRSGITWEGISKSMLETDRKYNPAGEYHDAQGNVKYYDNETDNYLQHHVQGIYTHQFTPYLFWSTVLNFTKGDGYYENYKEKKKLSDYGLSPQTIGGTTYKKSDVIIRQAMDNCYYVVSSNLKYEKDNLSANGSLSYSIYDGDHFGNLIWAQYNENVPNNHKWYDNNGLKHDFGSFVRGEYTFAGDRVHIFADLQYRHIRYTLNGKDKDFVSLDKELIYNFLNPKVGASFSITPENMIYASLAVGHKEPTRSDIKEAIKAGKSDQVVPERLCDYELGYNHSGEKWSFAANLFFMEYLNQLLETGKISETGYNIKENVPESFRRGIELSGAWRMCSWMKFDANLALSRNKIKNYTAWVDRYDNPDMWTPMSQISEYYESTNIIMSPEVVGMAMVTFNPVKNLSFSLSGKYVGRQYYDNTSNIERSLPAYNIFALQAHYSLSKIKFSIFVDNLLNRKYAADAWVYRAVFANGASDYIEEGLFPQAGINAMLKVSYTF